jgi:hypothetical protein
MSSNQYFMAGQIWLKAFFDERASFRSSDGDQGDGSWGSLDPRRLASKG